jgi:hypothetical protein
MSRMPSKPLLFCDVDGVISLFGWPADRCPAGAWALVDGIAHLLSAAAGRHLHRLASTFELVWCTGWDERANEHLPRALGLPSPLPTLTLVTPSMAHKRAAIDAYAPDRAAAWIDDRLDEACEAWAAQRPAPTLLVRTEPATGLDDEHVAALEDWAARLPANA